MNEAVRGRVLEDLSQVKARMEAMMAEDESPEQELARLRAENARLRESKANARGVSCKVTDKGGVSVYGMGRFPVTLYAGQWERLFAHLDEIKAFIEVNRSKLSFKE